MTQVRYGPDGRLLAVFRDRAHDSPTHGDFVGWVGTYDDIATGREGSYRIRLKDNMRGPEERGTGAVDCGYPGLEVLPDGTFIATTYGHWVDGEQPYVISVRFALAHTDALLAGG